MGDNGLIIQWWIEETLSTLGIFVKDYAVAALGKGLWCCDLCRMVTNKILLLGSHNGLMRVSGVLVLLGLIRINFEYNWFWPVWESLFEFI